MTRDTQHDCFAFFALEYGVMIDLVTLRARHHALQKKYHPNAQARNPQAQALATRQASFIQDAYNRLLNPATRIQHLIALHCPQPLTAAQLDADFLAQMMALHEQVTTDTTADILSQLQVHIDATLKQAEALWQTAYSSGQLDSWQALVDKAEKMRFLINMKQQLSY